MIRIVLHGAGRMAQGVLAELQERPQFELIAIVSRSRPADLPTAAPPDVPWFSSLDQIDTGVDLLIDFTLPGGPASAAVWCQKNNVAMLSGTTGLSDTDKKALRTVSADVPVLWASNMSLGIALISALARQAAVAIGGVADITVSEVHHQHKQDAPSGTALTLAEVVMEGRAQSILSKAAVEDRAQDFEAGASSPGSSDEQEEERDDGEIAFISVRKGEVIGEHTVCFELAGEIIEISHKARDRGVFAKGALNAGAWLAQQKPGYYSTSDWLDIG